MRPTPDGPPAPGAALTSTRDARVRRVVALHDRAERDRSARYLVEGPNALAEVAAAGTVEEVYATVEGAAQIPPACTAPVTLVAPHVLARMADSVTPRGVVAVARHDRADLGSVFGGDLVLVLDGVSDPGNVGTVVRTAVAAGAGGIVLTRGSVDPWNPKAVRASAGAVARVPIVVDVVITDVIAAARAAGHHVVASAADASSRYDEPGALEPPVTLLFGSEAHGLSPSVRAAADAVLSIPQRGPVESLNLAAAVAVIAFEAARIAAARHAEGPQ